MKKNSKIYVAGHRGLVGSAIWKSLKNKGYRNLVGRTHAQLDLLDGLAVKDFFEEEKPEYVFLAAAFVGGIMANSLFRADFIYKNLQIQQHIIGEAYRSKVKKLLFLGSTCIYPKNVHQPMKEDALLTAPLEFTNEPYALAKIAGLKMCESFNMQYGTNYIAVMPTNLYGPNDNFHLENGHVLPAMIRKIYLSKCLMEANWGALVHDLKLRPIVSLDLMTVQESKEAVTADVQNKIRKALALFGIDDSQLKLWGSGKPLREFLWSEEMADACVFVMENVQFSDLNGLSDELQGLTTSQMIEQGVPIPDVRNCHINVGTGKEITIADLAQCVKKTVGYKGTILWDSSRPDGTMRKLIDVSKLNKLGWHHKIEIEEGVRKLYDWYLYALDENKLER